MDTSAFHTTAHNDCTFVDFYNELPAGLRTTVSDRSTASQYTTADADPQLEIVVNLVSTFAQLVIVAIGLLAAFLILLQWICLFWLQTQLLLKTSAVLRTCYKIPDGDDARRNSVVEKERVRKEVGKEDAHLDSLALSSVGRNTTVTEQAHLHVQVKEEEVQRAQQCNYSSDDFDNFERLLNTARAPATTTADGVPLVALREVVSTGSLHRAQELLSSGGLQHDHDDLLQHACPSENQDEEECSSEASFSSSEMCDQRSSSWNDGQSNAVVSQGALATHELTIPGRSSPATIVPGFTKEQHEQAMLLREEHQRKSQVVKTSGSANMRRTYRGTRSKAKQSINLQTASLAVRKDRKDAQRAVGSTVSSSTLARTPLSEPSARCGGPPHARKGGLAKAGQDVQESVNVATKDVADAIPWDSSGLTPVDAKTRRIAAAPSYAGIPVKRTENCLTLSDGSPGLYSMHRAKLAASLGKAGMSTNLQQSIGSDANYKDAKSAAIQKVDKARHAVVKAARSILPLSTASPSFSPHPPKGLNSAAAAMEDTEIDLIMDEDFFSSGQSKTVPPVYSFDIQVARWNAHLNRHHEKYFAPTALNTAYGPSTSPAYFDLAIRPQLPFEWRSAIDKVDSTPGPSQAPRMESMPQDPICYKPLDEFVRSRAVAIVKLGPWPEAETDIMAAPSQVMSSTDDHGICDVDGTNNVNPDRHASANAKPHDIILSSTNNLSQSCEKPRKKLVHSASISPADACITEQPTSHQYRQKELKAICQLMKMAADSAQARDTSNVELLDKISGPEVGHESGSPFESTNAGSKVSMKRKRRKLRAQLQEAWRERERRRVQVVATFTLEGVQHLERTSVYYNMKRQELVCCYARGAMPEDVTTMYPIVPIRDMNAPKHRPPNSVGEAKTHPQNREK